MRRCRLAICVLMISIVPLAVYAQSLGAVARKLREERHEQGNPHLKVYTNDDLETPAERTAEGQPQESAQPEAGSENTGKAGAKEAAGKAEKKQKTLTPEEEMEKRTAEVNKEYIGRIEKIRKEIKKNQDEVARLQHGQIKATYQFRTTNEISPSVYQYQQQMKSFGEQIKAAREKLVSLQSQLDDAQEAARHAGVPHATDY